ncbi:MAG: hypothetical protein ACD_63C00115G0007 [uncultured bacterium]|nr:MAG: hypothetical protein ACD_63C00115G0007 [uncultured bacterium]
MREKITKINALVGFVLAVIPIVLFALVVFAYSSYSPLRRFMDSVLELMMEHGINWFYWIILIFAIMAAALVISSFLIPQKFPRRFIWILDIFTILLSAMDILLFFLVYNSM